MPASEARTGGRLHSLLRDRAAISHHYDVSNRFYELLLGPSMVYSCAYFEDPADPLEAAQARKLELICRKLRLQPGERLLDIGCGWGSLLLHAAEHHGVRGVGVTLSEHAGRAGARADPRRRAGRPASRCACSTTASSATGRSTRSPASACTSTSAAAQLGALRRHVHGLLRPGGLFLNHGIARLRSAPPDGDRFISPLRLPRRRAAPA